MLQRVLQSFPVSIEVHSPLIGGARVRGAWHAFASVVMVAGWSVVFSSCSTSVCLCAALTSCSLSVFSLFHLTLLSLCLHPSLPLAASPQFPFPILSPLLFSTQVVFWLLSSQILPISFFVLKSYECFSVSSLTLMCWCFSPGHFVLLAGIDRTSTGAWLATAQPTGEAGRCVALSTALRSLALLGAHTS